MLQVGGLRSLDPAALWPWGDSASNRGKGGPTRKAENLTAVCEPIV
jgi:hypothetical protein